MDAARRAPLRPRWRDAEARDAVEHWADVPDALALRVYSSRLIGADPSLVLHGGGNTSVKTKTAEGREILWVKGSGRDLVSVGPGDFAPLDLARLRTLETDAADPLSGKEPSAHIEPLLEAARLDRDAPFPSVEALLHAFVPDAYVDHTHADPVLVVANQPEGKAMLAGVLKARFAVLDYVMPGLGLARAVAALRHGNPALEGVVVRHHGVFTWGRSAHESFERMLACVGACEALTRVLAAGQDPHEPRDELRVLPCPDNERAAQLAALIRGALSLQGEPGARRVVLESRIDGFARRFVDAVGLEERAERALLTPDHVTRTRCWPLLLEAGLNEPLDSVRERLAEGLAQWATRVEAYAKAVDAGIALEARERCPNVVLVPGVGLFAAGRSRREAVVAADIAQRALDAVACGDLIGRYEPPAEQHAAELEFWPLQRAKMEASLPLEGRVALVTGAAGAIGAGVAVELARRGAALILADRPGSASVERLARVRRRVAEVSNGLAAQVCAFDVTDHESCEAALRRACLIAGGVDLLVLSHGMAEVGDIADLSPERVSQVFSVNALGSFHVLAAFVRQVRAEGRGGDVVLISTKNVPEPGASFGAYSASKAAAHQLARVAAIELAPLDVRVNMVSPDAVFGDDEVPSLLWQDVGAKRARSKGMDPAELPERYRRRNLLKSRVTAEHVAEAVLFFAERRTPTTGAVIPVDGGLPGSFPR